MSHSRPFDILLMVALLGMGCRGAADLPIAEPPAGYPLAYAMHDCAPWDGPAIAILLTEQPLDSTKATYPLARVMLYPRGESMPGHTYRWPADPEMGSGNRCVSEDSCALATAGEVTLGRVIPDSVMDGQVRLRFASGADIAGGFHAVWLRRQVMCG